MNLENKILELKWTKWKRLEIVLKYSDYQKMSLAKRSIHRSDAHLPPTNNKKRDIFFFLILKKKKRTKKSKKKKKKKERQGQRK